MHYNLVKQSNRRYLEELKNKASEMPNVYKAVNIMQKTEWVINEPIFNLMEELLINNYPLGNLPVNPETIPLPIRPLDIDTNEDAKKKWKRLANKVYSERGQAKSKFIQVTRILSEAKILLDKGGFFYPYQLDFRSRIYPKPAMLSPQSADYSRALLKFKYGKRMGSPEVIDRFKVAGAGLFGEADKEEIPARIKWVNDNHQNIIDCVGNAKQNTWWTKADKPFCFLAWCHEYKLLADTNFSESFITTLPIQSDCSNSGLQHYSAMMRDEFGGSATNLVPQSKPADIYGLVAEKVIEKLKVNTNPYAKKWLDYGVDRKLCKKPVMCLPYSLTRYTGRKHLEEHVIDQDKEGKKQNTFGDDLFDASLFLLPVVWDSINEIIISARGIMDYLKKIAKLVSKENLPVVWTTPLKFPVFMACYKTESRRVKTKMGDSIVKLSIISDTTEVDSKKTQQSVCANFIHSLDASCLMLAVVKAYERGVDCFSMIHDSFGTVAPDVSIMAEAIRDAFCEVYEQDVLQNFADEMYAMLSDKNRKKFPDKPEKGNLDLALVKKSVFFCV